VDASTNALVVTFSRAVHDSKGNLFGALGLDMWLGHVRSRIFSPNVQCPPRAKCFLVSRSAHLLLDPYDDGKLLTGEAIYFGTRDGDLAAMARDLSSRGYLKQSSCLDYTSVQQQSFMTLDIPEEAITGTTSCDDSPRSYVIVPVPGTSFFLAAVSVGNAIPPLPCCSAICGASYAVSSSSCSVPCRGDLSLPSACTSFEPQPSLANVQPCPGRATDLPPNSGTGLSAAAIGNIVTWTVLFGCLGVYFLFALIPLWLERCCKGSSPSSASSGTSKTSGEQEPPVIDL
jgi:hypothetical protein